MAARRKRTTSTRSTTARKTASARPAKPAPIPPVVGPGERLFVLSVPFSERAVAAANGARWDGFHRQSIYVGQTLPYGLTPYASPDYSWERWVEDEANGHVLPPQPSPVKFTPRPHQQVAIDKIEASAARGYRGFLEADDVGLGKTVASWEGALRVAAMRGAQTVLVMCPKGVIPHWRRTIAALGDSGLRVVVINYDQAKKLLSVPDSAASAARARTKNKRIADSGQPLVDWDIVIFDESHRLKNQDAQRTRAANRIARYAAAAKTAPFVIWMSATAGQNPVELGYLAPLFSQLTGATKSDLKDFGQWLSDQGFAVTYNTRFKKWDWGVIPDSATPAEAAGIEAAKEADLARIRLLLFEGSNAPSIRRLPTDIAGWPEIQRILHPVELDRDERRLYEQAWTQFRRDMRLFARGRDPKGGMAARLRFRQKASLVRVPGTAELVLDLVENGHQVAVCVEFHETTDALREALSAAKVPVGEYSGRNEATREQERLAFQRGDYKVILFSTPEGISLHANEALGDGTTATAAPRTAIVHDPRYSGIESLQIEGRCHRDGQNANIYYMFAADTVEGTIVRTLVGRVRSTKAMAGDDVTAVKALEDVLDQVALNDSTFLEGHGEASEVAVSAPAVPRTVASSVAPAPAASTTSTPRGGPARPARSVPAQPARSQPPTPLPAQGPPVRPVQARTSAKTVARPVRPATEARRKAMTPEERAFREALAGGKVTARRQKDLAAERTTFEERLRNG